MRQEIDFLVNKPLLRLTALWIIVLSPVWITGTLHTLGEINVLTCETALISMPNSQMMLARVKNTILIVPIARSAIVSFINLGRVADSCHGSCKTRAAHALMVPKGGWGCWVRN